MTVYVGIDPSIRRTGMALIDEEYTLLASEIVKPYSGEAHKRRRVGGIVAQTRQVLLDWKRIAKDEGWGEFVVTREAALMSSMSTMLVTAGEAIAATDLACLLVFRDHLRENENWFAIQPSSWRKIALGYGKAPELSKGKKKDPKAYCEAHNELLQSNGLFDGLEDPDLLDAYLIAVAGMEIHCLRQGWSLEEFSQAQQESLVDQSNLKADGIKLKDFVKQKKHQKKYLRKF